MAIILEGFDNSGKSTLAASLGLRVVHPGPRPKNDEETYKCLDAQLAMAATSVVMDRVTAISQPCYDVQPSLKFYSYTMNMVNTPHCIVVYCRPPIEVIMNFSKHIAKDYDDVAKVQWLFDNAERIIENYDRLMAMIPHFKYDYTNPDKSMIDLVMRAQTDIKEWEHARNNLL